MMSLQEYAEKHAEDMEPVKPTGSPLVKRIEEERAAQERAAEICRTYQKNTNTAAKLEAEILKGLKAGRPIEELFLLAMQALSLLTNTSNTADQAEKDLRGIYGYGLRQPGAAALEAAAVRERIDRMTAAIGSGSVPPEECKPIEKAIAAHRKALAWLEGTTE